MSKNTSISLSDRESGFIDSCVQSERYASASDVVRAGLRLLEEHEAEYEAKVKAWHQAIDDGLASGPGREIDWEDFKRRARQRRAERAALEYHDAKEKYLEARTAAETATETATTPIRKSG